jgi:hypothetical protein
MPPEEIAVHYFPAAAEAGGERELPWVDKTDTQ